MNIDSINNHGLDYRKSGFKHSNNNVLLLEEKSKLSHTYANKKINNGSFITFNGAAVNISDKVLTKLSKFCNEHTSITQNLFAFMLGATLRPLAIITMPFQKKNKDDKKFAAVQGISSATVGFCFAYLVMSPLDSAAKKARKFVQGIKVGNLPELTEKQIKRIKEIYKVENLADLAHSKEFEKVTRIMDMHVDTMFLGLAKAMLTVALIPPILKYLFGIEKGKENKNNDVMLKNDFQFNKQNKGIEQFAGGLK